MYAYTATGFRAINAGDPLAPGETAAETVPQSVLDAIDVARVAKETNAKNLRTQADQALGDLRAFRDNAAPTNAQVVAAVKLLCRVAIGLIRLHLGKLDAQD